MSVEEYFDYLKLCVEITDKLDNTAEYESWLLVQDYADYEHRELIRLKSIINEAREYIIEKVRNNCWIDIYEANELVKILNKVGDSSNE